WLCRSIHHDRRFNPQILDRDHDGFAVRIHVQQLNIFLVSQFFQQSAAHVFGSTVRIVFLVVIVVGANHDNPPRVARRGRRCCRPIGGGRGWFCRWRSLVWRGCRCGIRSSRRSRRRRGTAASQCLC